MTDYRRAGRDVSFGDLLVPQRFHRLYMCGVPRRQDSSQ
jgi:hypothetical protein